MDKQRSTAFMMKLVGDVATSLAAQLVEVRTRLGLFKAMAGACPVDAQALAERSGIAPRYAEEWLAAMAGAGYVLYDAGSGRFELPDEHAVFLANPQSEYHLGGLFGALPVLAAALPRLTQAFQDGSGIPFAEFGDALPMALAAMNRPVYEARLVALGSGPAGANSVRGASPLRPASRRLNGWRSEARRCRSTRCGRRRPRSSGVGLRRPE